MVKPSKSPAAMVDPHAERHALKTKKLAVGDKVRVVTPNTHIARSGEILKIDEPKDARAWPMVTIRGKTAAGKVKTWRNRPSLVLADAGAESSE